MFDYPMIAAVRQFKDLRQAVNSKCDTIFMMSGELTNIFEAVNIISSAGKKIYLHIELIKGIACNKESVRFIAEKVKPTGIVTTKGHLIKPSMELGLKAIHHIFIIDTQAFKMGIKNVQASKPDGVEIMPGLMPRIIKEFVSEVNLPLVVGGLLKTKREIESILNAGANAAASGDPSLWNIGLENSITGKGDIE